MKTGILPTQNHLVTWFSATEIESQPVSELILYFHQALGQLMVASLPNGKRGQRGTQTALGLLGDNKGEGVGWGAAQLRS